MTKKGGGAIGGSSPPASRMAAQPSDEELRKRLVQLGFSPGPITDGTRGLYLNKLKTLSGQGGTTIPRSSPNPKPSPPSPPGTRGRMPPRPATPPPPDNNPTPPAQNGGVVCAATPLAKAQVVVGQLLSSLNSPAHLASDTALLFPGGEVLLASRGIMAVRCPEMTPLLYSREEPYLVTITTLSGQLTHFFVRPSELVADLKEKISLTQGIPILQQRLVFMQNELHNNLTLHCCGVTAGSTLNLVLIASAVDSAPTTYFTSSISPALSIAHLTLGLGLEQLGGVQRLPLQPAKVPLPPHITHILHIYDVPSSGFEMFVRFLYCGELAAGDRSNVLPCFVCCFVLGEYFSVPGLARDCLESLTQLLTVDDALLLVQFADTIKAQTLRDTCIKFLEAHRHT